MKLSSSAEQIKSPSSSAAEEEKHNKESCPAPSSASSENEEKPKWTAEEMENMNDNQLKEVAASLMAEKDAPPKHKCWQKCAFDKLRPYFVWRFKAVQIHNGCSNVGKPTGWDIFAESYTGCQSRTTNCKRFTSVRSKDLNVSALIKKRLPLLVSLNHVFRISMICSNCVNSAYLLNSI
nr:hypothetical protein Iba_scaffold1536CG0680 [Ipomoea batatas]